MTIERHDHSPPHRLRLYPFGIENLNRFGRMGSVCWHAGTAFSRELKFKIGLPYQEGFFKDDEAENRSSLITK
jgi:hypothetical protein